MIAGYLTACCGKSRRFSVTTYDEQNVTGGGGVTIQYRLALLTSV